MAVIFVVTQKGRKAKLAFDNVVKALDYVYAHGVTVRSQSLDVDVLVELVNTHSVVIGAFRITTWNS